ncbi:MAG: GTPase HflX [Bacteroidales bacterium]|jgi:GTP-binding protein HflX|nr:GTPase HflX [Bacteroidales bacterium]MDD2569724.1 GTPase HflX [Bacteroidales bacterium]MDD2811877.1 GTPase HflX [Bacteroidales bacterium]MDD3384174.1 GTPase HflX [Bacteroidales bacterium]MDD3810832.1 GTPase HflX [Bacteroidales bacterium]
MTAGLIDKELSRGERALLIGVVRKNQDIRTVTDYLDELEFLANTAGATILTRFIQRMEDPNPATLIGKGKMEEIMTYIEDHAIDLIIFDDDLTPTQLRNIEGFFKIKVLDRTNLILDIFASRAQTAYAKVQVELAQYLYILPRLAGMWTHLERQRGGIGMRGPGEREIETDRRIIRERIARLREELKKIDLQMATQRKNRGKLVRVALVGYTNVGKSTLMNLVSKSEVFAENKLFATLDTTTRKVVIENLPFLLSDTVGFIRKLPHHLVESFKSTLDEVRESDILLHVVDISHPGFEEQISVVEQTLVELGSGDKPTILIFNKIDAFTYEEKDPDDLTPIRRENFSLEDLMNSWMAKNNNPCIFISAKQKTNLEQLKQLLYDKVREIHAARYPYDTFLY